MIIRQNRLYLCSWCCKYSDLRYGRIKFEVIFNSGHTWINILFKYINFYDTNLTLEQIGELVKSVHNIQGEDIRFFTIPGKDKTIDGIWYWDPDPEGLEKVLVDFYK